MDDPKVLSGIAAIPADPRFQRPHVCYVLRLEGEKVYVGHTQNLPTRLWQHWNGLASNATRLFRPIELLHTVVCPSKAEARRKENELARSLRCLGGQNVDGLAFDEIIEVETDGA